MSNLTRWNPVRDMMEVQDTMDRFFNESWRSNYNSDNALALDVDESEDNYVVVASMPGIDPENINVEMHENRLTISGENQRAETHEGQRALVRERYYGRVSRTIRLPQTVNVDAITSQFDNGVLTLTLPKAEEVKPRRIAINKG